LSFSSDEFGAFKSSLDCSHDHIHMQLVVDLNDFNEQLAFIVNGEKIWTMHNNLVLKVRIVVTQDFFQI
jgi:hypothetical protein